MILTRYFTWDLMIFCHPGWQLKSTVKPTWSKSGLWLHSMPTRPSGESFTLWSMAPTSIFLQTDGYTLYLILFILKDPAMCGDTRLTFVLNFGFVFFKPSLFFISNFVDDLCVKFNFNVSSSTFVCQVYVSLWSETRRLPDALLLEGKHL